MPGDMPDPDKAPVGLFLGTPLGIRASQILKDLHMEHEGSSPKP